MPESPSNAGRLTSGAHRRDPLIRQAIRARRAIDLRLPSKSTPAGDRAATAFPERAKQWVEGDPPRGAIPGAS